MTNRLSSMLQLLVSAFFLLLLVGRSAYGQTTLGDLYDQGGERYNIRWASSGGGWRAMFASAAFANVFQQAGLFSETSSRLSAISTNSGSSWFSTQLFYSQAFYNLTVMAESPADLYNFTERWMATYEFLSDYVIDHPERADQLCNTTGLGNDPFVEVFEEICELLLQYDGDWTLLVTTMLLVASTDYGDPTFVDTSATAANRIPPLQNTDLYIMSALSPTSRVRTAPKVPVENRTTAKPKQTLPVQRPPDDALIYLGPPNAQDELYTTAQGVAYTVTNSGENFFYMSDTTRSDDLLLYRGTTENEYSMRDFNDFYLYDEPGDNTIDNPRFFGGGDLLEGQSFRPPFQGRPSVVQVAAMSSAAGAGGSPASPLVFAQIMANAWAHLADELGPLLLLPARVLFDLVANRIYQTATFDRLAVCSQWPQNCGDKDGWFLDGVYVENLALSATISQYQLSQGDPPNDKPLKILLTNTNTDWQGYEPSEFLQYFESPYNEGVDPGGHLSIAARLIPLRSPQLFQDFMDEAGLDAALEPIAGSNMTTAVWKGLTTLDNSVYGIQKDLTVDLMLINLNEPITTFIVGPAIIKNTTDPLAQMVEKIASNEILVQRVREFYEAGTVVN